MTIRLKDATKALAAVGITLKKTEGEYRVSYRGRASETEASAYYTNDIEDAVKTGLLMAQNRRS